MNCSGFTVGQNSRRIARYGTDDKEEYCESSASSQARPEARKRLQHYSKELLGFQASIRKSAQSWRELLFDIKAIGLASRCR